MGTLGASVAIAYFLAAQFGLALLSAPSDVAVFWPASGIAAGSLIVSGRRAYPALVVGVAVGSIAVSVTSGGSFLSSLVEVFCNVGEAVVAAWLLERWFRRPFTFGNLRRVAGFLGAAGLAAAVSAISGTATLTPVRTAAAYWEVWRAWFLSDGIGIVVVAPLIIRLGELWHEPPSRREWIEGLGVLGLTALACLYTMSSETGSWLSFSPSALVLPLLLWLTARCQPTFGIAGAFLASVAIMFATTFGVGRFGDAAVPIMARVKGAQVAIMTITTFTLVLPTLFEQRKKAEEGLRESEGRLAKERAMLARLHEVGSRLWLKRDLRQALDEILAGAIELLSADKGAIRILDTARGVLKIEAQRGFKQEFLDCFGEVSTGAGSPCCSASQSGKRMVIEDVEEDALFAPFLPIARAAGYRAVQSTPIMGREGALLGTLATHFRSVHKPAEQDLRLLDLYVRQAADIIEHHRAEDALRESEERLRLAQSKTGVGIWDWNLRTGKVTWTPELAAIYGIEPGTVKSYADFLDRVYPEDIEAIQANYEAVVRHGEAFDAEFRIIRADGQVRWVRSSGGTLYDEATGEPTRVLGNNADITARKQAELVLSERNAQLALAGKKGRVGVFTFDIGSGAMQVSPGYAAIHGLREGTSETTRGEWRTRVHADDLPRLDANLQRDIDAKRSEHDCEYRIICSTGEMRWIEARSFISYDREGAAVRIIGVNIDVTQRKKADLALAERNAYLTLAENAARVGYFAYNLDTGLVTVSEGYTAIHGLPEGTTQMTIDQWRASMHPDDLVRLYELRNRIYRSRCRGYTFDYRIIRAGGDIRWIESRGLISYDGEGQPRRTVGINIDVTERKQTETRLSDALAAGQVVAFEWDAATGRSQRSDNAERIMGLAEGRRFMRQVHADDRRMFKARIRGLSPDNPSYALTFRFVRLGGRQVWLEETAKGEFDGTGRLLRIKGLTRDISERKRVELALAERNAQVALAAKAARVGCYANNLETGLITVSEGYAAIHGLPEGTAQTTLSEWRPRVHPDDLVRFDELRQQIFGNRHRDYRFDYRIIRADRGVRWIESRGCVSYDEDGQPQQVIGINIDVTERKQTEARLSDALAAGQVVAFEWDALTGQSQRSDNAERILGIVQGAGFLRQVHPADRRNFNDLIRNLSPGNPSYTLTFRFARSDSRDVWLEEEAKGEFDTTGKLLRIKGLTRDITERKELQDHQNTLISELDHRVKNMLAIVSTVASRTQETSSSMEEFVAALDGRIKSMAITHELLSHRRWQGIPLAELVRRELAPYATASNTRIDGPDVVLCAEAGQVIAMVLHELATNAAKFGAISVKSGRISVRWSFRRNGHAEGWLRIEWAESGGPNVVPPARSGYGTSVVRELIPYELGGTVELAHLPEGVCCNLHIPAQWLSACAR
jgi:PAS domain S-box-containing protein